MRAGGSILIFTTLLFVGFGAGQQRKAPRPHPDSPDYFFPHLDPASLLAGNITREKVLLEYHLKWISSAGRERIGNLTEELRLVMQSLEEIRKAFTLAGFPNDPLTLPEEKVTTNVNLTRGVLRNRETSWGGGPNLLLGWGRIWPT